MTEKETLQQFQEIKCAIIAKYGKNDKPALREGWSDFTDVLCKGGAITMKQYESWSNPF